MRRGLMLPLWGLIGLAALTAAGCGGGRPPVTEVEGVVLLNGKPLPNAQVEFLPELSKFGAEMNSMAVTDENGRFRLTCNYLQLPGAVVGKHKVTVGEAPTPQEFRGMDAASQGRYTQYMAGLKNRPIPDEYGSISKTPLTIEVTADKKEYKLELTTRKF